MIPIPYSINIFAEFSRVDSSGNPVSDAAIEGLLLYRGGTVCDDSFSNYSAEAICRLLGYFRHFSWSSGSKWEIQSNYDIKMDNVQCSSGDWSSCTFTTYHNCGHYEDIFLACAGIGKLSLKITALIN